MFCFFLVWFFVFRFVRWLIIRAAAAEPRYEKKRKRLYLNYYVGADEREGKREKEDEG